MFVCVLFVSLFYSQPPLLRFFSPLSPQSFLVSISSILPCLYLPNPFLSLSSQHISVFISSPSPSLFLLSFLSFFFLLSLLSYFTPVSIFSFLFFPQSSLAIYINRCIFFLFRIDVSVFCKVNMANYR